MIPPPGELRRLREGLRLSQSELASALGFGPNGDRTVRSWEQGDIVPTPTAWCCFRYLVALSLIANHATLAQSMAGIWCRNVARSALPEVLK